MSDLKYDQATNDLILEDGDLALVEDGDAVAQHILQRLRTFLGEWFLDLTAGVPYYQDILKKNPNIDVVEQVFKREILFTPGVLELMSFSLELDTALRKLSLSFKVRTVDGPVSFENVEVGI